MPKIKSNGNWVGHSAGVVYRDVNGRQITQAMPSHYRDANTEAQQKQRSGMRNILAIYRLLKELLWAQFEEASTARRPYNCFTHYNLLLPAVDLAKDDYEHGRGLLAPYLVSQGSLPTLETEVVEGCLQFEMKIEDWRPDDRLRLIKITSEGAADGTPSYLHINHIDTFINEPKTQIVRSEPLSHGAYAFIHLRDNEHQASTQHLIIV